MQYQLASYPPPIMGYQEFHPAQYEPPRLCNFWFQTGTCKFGDRCKFSHETTRQAMSFRGNGRGAGFGRGRGRGRGGNTVTAKSDRVCFNFSETGSCTFGDSCRFVHPTDGAGVRSRGVGGRGSRTMECYHFKTSGQCPYGDQCWFSHESARPQQETKVSEEETEAAEGTDAPPETSLTDDTDYQKEDVKFTTGGGDGEDAVDETVESLQTWEIDGAPQ